ncbi:MAG: protein translocase subunit SecF, partial [Deltaproteobacteria bacterium]
LSRTIVTSLTVFLVCLALFLFGGEVIHDFSFALLFGIVIGTYSSIFVASPIVYEWRKGQKIRIRTKR